MIYKCDKCEDSQVYFYGSGKNGVTCKMCGNTWYQDDTLCNECGEPTVIVFGYGLSCINCDLEGNYDPLGLGNNPDGSEGPDNEQDN